MGAGVSTTLEGSQEGAGLSGAGEQPRLSTRAGRRVCGRPEIKPALGWVLASLIMGTVWVLRGAGRRCVAAPSSSQLIVHHFPGSWGVERSGHWGNGPGYKRGDPGYLERITKRPPQGVRR